MPVHFRPRWVGFSVGLFVAVLTVHQVTTSMAEHRRLAQATEVLEVLDDRMERVRWRAEVWEAALRDYLDGRISLVQAARLFRDSDAGNKISAARVRRMWPDLPSEEARYAADVLLTMRHVHEAEAHADDAYAWAEADFLNEFGVPPGRAG